MFLVDEEVLAGLAVGALATIVAIKVVAKCGVPLRPVTKRAMKFLIVGTSALSVELARAKRGLVQLYREAKTEVEAKPGVPARARK